MKLTRNYHFNPAPVALIALVNVLFLVVVFYAMSSRFVLQPGLAVSLPASAFLLAPQRNPEIVSITSAPTAAIYFRDRKLSIQEFRDELRTTKARSGSVIIKADRSTPYDLVTRVMNEALQQGRSVLLAMAPEQE